jgi:4-hydroxythreonine-4-phosphate dehydrogenase
MTRPIIAVTMGDPAGIGPEICLKMLNDRAVLDVCIPVVIGNQSVLSTLAGRLGIPLTADVVHIDDVDATYKPIRPAIVDMHIIVLDDFEPGTINSPCGHASYDYVAFAIDRTMAGCFDAITTAPICKEAMHMAGIDFPGHTEILASQAGVSGEVMMLHSPKITVSLVSTHVALGKVRKLVTRERVAHVIRLTHEMMGKVLGRTPNIAVLGLNPHAGEGGMFGDEEMTQIIPAVHEVAAEGIHVDGPMPADTAFTPPQVEKYDAYVCMYHDQALIPFKTLSFGQGVNVTLGIPLIRTSVDHGTAFDIAWKGQATHTSLVAALLLAAKLTEES